MAAPLLQRLTAWLCLAAALISGLAPAGGFVLCQEPDGCLTLEAVAGTDACSGCEDHGTGGAETDKTAPTATDESCPCIDLEVRIAARDHRVQPKRTWSPALERVAIPAAWLADARASRPCAGPAPRTGAPRPPGSLLLIRTVVLLL